MKIKKLLIACCFLTSVQLFAQNVWESVHEEVKKTEMVSFETIKQHISLNTSDFREESNQIIVGDGYVVIDEKSIRSYDSTEQNNLEFEYKFCEQLSSSNYKNIREDLSGIKIALDILPKHKYFNERKIGNLRYQEFVDKLQNTLQEKLQEKKAVVSKIRSISSVELSLNNTNKNPPNIVVSTQFNNDKQDCMTTFCGGNITKEELKSEKQRARLVHAILTDKAYKSMALGTCIVANCLDKLEAVPRDWQSTNFENTSCPVKSKLIENPSIKLQERDGYLNGILMRNLMLNGIFSQVFVMPFPDMKWIGEQVKAGEEIEWIKQYTQVLTEALVEYVTKSKCF